jgi:lysozyme
MRYTYSRNGIELTESFEGCNLTSYQDVKGVWTIGYGHTGPNVVVGMQITQQQADDLLASDIQWAANFVNATVKAPINQNIFDALTDFVYNVGSGNWANSTLLALLNKGDFVNAALQFECWDHANGQVIAGLLRRREAEAQLFEMNSGGS